MFGRKETPVVRREILQKNLGEFQAEREGNSVTLKYPWAGRFTKDNVRLSVDDIRALAAFVEETDPTGADNG